MTFFLIQWWIWLAWFGIETWMTVNNKLSYPKKQSIRKTGNGISMDGMDTSKEVGYLCYVLATGALPRTLTTEKDGVRVRLRSRLSFPFFFPLVPAFSEQEPFFLFFLIPTSRIFIGISLWFLPYCFREQFPYRVVFNNFHRLWLIAKKPWKDLEASPVIKSWQATRVS